MVHGREGTMKEKTEGRVGGHVHIIMQLTPTGVRFNYKYKYKYRI